jgi:hypothetical protein
MALTIEKLREQVGNLVLQLWEKDATIDGLSAQLAALAPPADETPAEETEPTPINRARGRSEGPGA